MTNALPIGHTLQNEYKIERVLGAGGFGITYLAKDINLHHLVVIKEFLPQDMATRDQSRISVTPFTKDTQSYKHLLKRFSEEAQLLAKMRHPNIVKVTRFFNANNTAYFVMEYTEGETLKEYLQRDNTMSEDEILSVMMPILEGAKYVHSQGFLHRDIAPDNIYLTKNGMPILIDFGAARDAIAEESKNISSIVKEGYSSPEQYTVNNQQNASSDIYALGSVFYRMITGKVPPNAPHRQTALLNDELDPMGDLSTQHKGKYSQKLLHAVTKSMNIRAADRFASVSEFQEALLGDVVVDSAPRNPTRHIASSTQKKPNNNGLLIALVVLLLLLLAGAGYVYMEQNNSEKTAPVQVDDTSSKTDTKTISAASKQNEELEKSKRELAKLKQQKEEAERQKQAERLRKEREEIERLKTEQKAELERLSQEKAEREAAERSEAEASRLQQEQMARESENYTKYKVINVANWDTLNVRTNPFVSRNNKVGELQHNARNIRRMDCKYNHKGVKWCQIEHKTNGYPLRGWVVARCIKPQGNTSTAARSGGYRVVNIRSNDTLSVRNGPGSNYYKTGDLPYNATGVVLGECRYSNKGGRWCVVKWGSVTGWSSATYLRR